ETTAIHMAIHVFPPCTGIARMTLEIGGRIRACPAGRKAGAYLRSASSGEGAPKERTRARQARISAVLCPKADMLHEFTELAVCALLPRTRFIRRYSVTAMPAIEQEADRCHDRCRSGRIF